MAHEAKKSTYLHIGLWQCTLSNGLSIQVTGLGALLQYSVCQVVYLFLEETTL